MGLLAFRDERTLPFHELLYDGIEGRRGIVSARDGPADDEL